MDIFHALISCAQENQASHRGKEEIQTYRLNEKLVVLHLNNQYSYFHMYPSGSPECEGALCTEQVFKQWQWAQQTVAGAPAVSRNKTDALEKQLIPDPRWAGSDRGLDQPSFQSKGSVRWEGLIRIPIWKETNFNIESMNERVNQ